MTFNEVAEGLEKVYEHLNKLSLSPYLAISDKRTIHQLSVELSSLFSQVNRQVQQDAAVPKLVDGEDLKSSEVNPHEGSIPSSGTSNLEN